MKSGKWKTWALIICVALGAAVSAFAFYRLAADPTYAPLSERVAENLAREDLGFYFDEAARLPHPDLRAWPANGTWTDGRFTGNGDVIIEADWLALPQSQFMLRFGAKPALLLRFAAGTADYEIPGVFIDDGESVKPLVLSADLVPDPCPGHQASSLKPSCVVHVRAEIKGGMLSASIGDRYLGFIPWKGETHPLRLETWERPARLDRVRVTRNGRALDWIAPISPAVLWLPTLGGALLGALLLLVLWRLLINAQETPAKGGIWTRTLELFRPTPKRLVLIISFLVLLAAIRIAGMYSVPAGLRYAPPLSEAALPAILFFLLLFTALGYRLYRAVEVALLAVTPMLLLLNFNLLCRLWPALEKRLSVQEVGHGPFFLREGNEAFLVGLVITLALVAASILRERKTLCCRTSAYAASLVLLFLAGEGACRMIAPAPDLASEIVYAGNSFRWNLEKDTDFLDGKDERASAKGADDAIMLLGSSVAAGARRDDELIDLGMALEESLKRASGVSPPVITHAEPGYDPFRIATAYSTRWKKVNHRLTVLALGGGEADAPGARLLADTIASLKKENPSLSPWEWHNKILREINPAGHLPFGLWRLRLAQVAAGALGSSNYDPRDEAGLPMEQRRGWKIPPTPRESLETLAREAGRIVFVPGLAPGMDWADPDLAQLMSSIAKERGAVFLDLREEMKKHTNEHLFRDSSHMTYEGLARFADAIAAGLSRNGLL